MLTEPRPVAKSKPTPALYPDRIPTEKLFEPVMLQPEVPLTTTQGIAFVPSVTSLKMLEADPPDASSYSIGSRFPNP